MKILYFLKSIWDFWSIKTLFVKYATSEEWCDAGEPLDFKTAWEVAKSIWFDEPSLYDLKRGIY